MTNARNGIDVISATAAAKGYQLVYEPVKISRHTQSSIAGIFTTPSWQRSPFTSIQRLPSEKKKLKRQA
ncbi:MAG: hypothetical protein ABSD38_21005 [Syntrophorhabdales bacterium]|jgi:hypothetical protein